MKKTIATSNAPLAIGPYAQGTCSNGFVFASGQLPIDPATGEFPKGGIEEQTRQSLKNLRAVLEAGGTTMEKVLKTTVFLKDMDDFAKMNKIYEEAFGPSNFPARSAIQVAKLPKDALVEIEAIAEI